LTPRAANVSLEALDPAFGWTNAAQTGPTSPGDGASRQHLDRNLPRGCLSRSRSTSIVLPERPAKSVHSAPTIFGRVPGLSTTPITWEFGMTTTENPTREAFSLGSGGSQRDLAERLEGYIELKSSGRIRDLHVVCFDDMIILQGRSRTYHAKQLAQQAALDYTEGGTLLSNQIEVC
jgi:hypothetical protein